ncbi:MAG: hypothetical protein HC932_05095 [Thermales bacterium]|nr:hypothetical protein [Thermales bacterium]
MSIIKLFINQLQNFFVIVSLFFLSFNTLPAFAQDSLIPDPCPPQGCPVTGSNLPEDVSRQEVADLILFVANILTYVIGALAVLFIVIGALLMVIGKGEVGAKLIKNALIGLVVAILVLHSSLSHRFSSTRYIP